MIPLTPEQQSAASGILAGPASPVAPQAPAPTPDLSGQGQGALAAPSAAPEDNGTLPLPQFAPGTFQSKLKAAADQLGIPPGPGGWAKSLVGAAQSALAGVGTAAGDTVNAEAEIQKTHPRGGAGVFDYLGAQQNAKAAREQAAQKAQDEHLKALSGQERDKAETAKINVDTHYQQTLIHQATDKHNEENAKAGELAVNAATAGDPEHGIAGAQITAADVDEKQLPLALKNKSYDAFTMTSWPTKLVPVTDPETGKQQIGPDGEPLSKYLYTIVATPKTIVLNPKSAKFINENLGTDYSGGEGDKPAQQFPGTLGMGLFQQASNAYAVRSAADTLREKTKLDKLNAAKLDAQLSAQDDLGQNFFHVAAQLPLAGQMDYVTGHHLIPDPTGKSKTGIVDPKSAEYAQSHPDAGQALMNLYGGPKDYQTIIDAQRKDAEKGLVTPEDRFKEDQENKRAADKKKLVDLAPPDAEGLTGEAYIAKLPSNIQNVIRAVGEGRLVMSPRQLQDAGGESFANTVTTAFPDYDKSKAETWGKTRNEYMGSGKTATQITPAYNTALEHMQDLYNNTTAEGIANPLSKAYQDRQIALGYVTREVGKAVAAGAMTQKESQELLDTLSGGMTPGLKRERIIETAKLLHDKIEEYQTKFDQAAPSSAVKVPLLMSPKAMQSYDFVTSGAEPGSQPAAAAPTPNPATAAQAPPAAAPPANIPTAGAPPITAPAVTPGGFFGQFNGKVRGQ